jgi:uncharacterized DUF497 family protein
MSYIYLGGGVRVGSAKGRRKLEETCVDFADAATVLEDPLAVTIPDEHSEEPRFVTVGCDAEGRLLVVAYAWRGERIRIISARRVTCRERRQYEA